ncbi:MAG: carboxymuconolactone decarboxylase family protein [Nitrospirota bacterium]|nr:MAG: carboxymuconolactone decarboxylase family protein [Nitrospirota bacterium]
MKSNSPVEDIFAQVQGLLGFVPNLYKEMSKAPSVLSVYHKGQESLSQGALTAKEQQVVQLTVAVYNDCRYCKAAHQWLGQKMGLSQDEIQEIRSRLSQQTDMQVANLVRATKLILENRGWLDPEELTRLEQQGISRAKLYEIIAYIGLKTISTYINHIAETPIDEQFNS